MNSRWSDNLRKRMDAHKEPSPDGLWEDIEQIVTKGFHFQSGERPVQSLSGRKKILLWTKRIGASAAILFVLLFIGNLFLKEAPPHSPVISQKSEPEHKPGNNLSIDHDSERILLAEESHREFTPDNKNRNFMASASTVPPSKEFAPMASDSKVSPSKEAVSKALAGRKTDDLYIDKEMDGLANVKEDKPDRIDQTERPGEESGTEEKTTDRHAVSKEQPRENVLAPNNIHFPSIARRNKPARWETSLYASNTSSGSSKEYTGYRSFMAEEVSGTGDNIAPLLVKYPHEGIVAANKQTTVHTEAKHRLPATLGASIKYNVNEKWSLTSGLTYTILSSQLQSGSHSHYYSSEQTLYNIGIPLGINYNLLKVGKLSIYIYGGGAVEKNVSGKLITNYVLNDKLESTEKENISIDRLQWSLNTAVGIEYNLFSKIGLYTEPGLIYYFKNGSEIETIYKEKPVNINFRVGLRFALGE